MSLLHVSHTVKALRWILDIPSLRHVRTDVKRLREHLQPGSLRHVDVLGLGTEERKKHAICDGSTRL